MDYKEKVKCACMNNTPVPLPNDEKGGERYECYYCKFKWRYILIDWANCEFCEEPTIKLSETYNDNKVRCSLCRKEYLTSNFKKIIRLAYW